MSDALRVIELEGEATELRTTNGRFIAQVRRNKEAHYLGTFSTVAEAAKAVAAKRVELFEEAE